MTTNWTHNAEVQIHGGEHLASQGAMYSIVHRWPAVANNAKVGILLDVRSDWFTFTEEYNITGTFFLDKFIVSSYSGGTTPKIGNRNLLFNGVNTLSSIILADPTIELLVTSTSLIERVLPGGSGPQSPGGNSDQGGEIHVNPGRKLLFELTNMSGQTQDADVLIVAFEGQVNSADWTGKLL